MPTIPPWIRLSAELSRSSPPSPMRPANVRDGAGGISRSRRQTLPPMLQPMNLNRIEAGRIRRKSMQRSCFLNDRQNSRAKLFDVRKMLDKCHSVSLQLPMPFDFRRLLAEPDKEASGSGGVPVEPSSNGRMIDPPATGVSRWHDLASDAWQRGELLPKRPNLFGSAVR